MAGVVFLLPSNSWSLIWMWKAMILYVDYRALVALVFKCCSLACWSVMGISVKILLKPFKVNDCPLQKERKKKQHSTRGRMEIQFIIQGMPLYSFQLNEERGKQQS